MRISPFVFLTQCSQAASRAEALWRSVERAVGAPLVCFVVPEHDIVLCVAPERPGQVPAGGPQRLRLPDPPSGDSASRQLVFCVDGPGARAPTTGVAVGAGIRAWAGSVEAGAAPALRLTFDPTQDRWTIERGAAGLNALYYRTARDRDVRLAVSTQLRALLPQFESRPQLDHTAVARYLCNGFFCEPETPLAGVRSVLPFEVLRGQGTGSLWDRSTIPSSKPADADPPGDAAAHRRVARERLVRAVDVVTDDRSDVACTLSGGVDSSTVAAVAAALLGKTVSTYTLVFEDAEINEAQYAAAVARRLGTRHREVMLTQPEFEGSLDWMLGALDLPTTDGLNSLLISRAIGNDGHTQALVGVGSDELFGGHECMQRVPKALSILRTFQYIPAGLRGAARSAVAGLTGCARDPWLPSHGLRGKLNALLATAADPLDVYLLSRRVLLPQAVQRLMPRTDARAFALLPEAVLERTPAGLHSQPMSRQVSYYEQLVYLRNQLLRDMQMIDVATGVDVRAPFVDAALVSSVNSMPAADVFSGQRPKQFLIDCVKDVLPVEAYERPKLGFVLPIGHWLGGLVSGRFRGLSSRPELLDYLELDLGAIEMIMADCAAARGRVFYTREWCLFVLLDWCCRNLLDTRSV